MHYVKRDCNKMAITRDWKNWLCKSLQQYNRLQSSGSTLIDIKSIRLWMLLYSYLC